MDTGVSTEYVAVLQEEANMYRQDIVRGKCGSFEQYKYKTGYIQGLEKAEQILHEVIEDMLRIQDLDEDSDGA